MDYILPFKAGAGFDVPELGRYVDSIRTVVRVLVVDGSEPEAFESHRRYFAGVTHVRPNPAYRYANGKVDGVRTGLELCSCDRVVIADDDVRYEPGQLVAIEALLDDVDLVRPQNYFSPAPWHAQWDTARSLLNRALSRGDYPGTLALRVTDRLRREGYDGDVMFENLELIRTVRADGGRELVADIYVRRVPPTVGRFWQQRLRQAYDSQAQPVRLLLELALLPGLCWAARRPRRLLAAGLVSVGVAEAGRRRGGGAAYLAWQASALTPAWLAERAVCAWGALWQRWVLGGTSYSGLRIKRAAHSEAWLRRRQRTASRPAEGEALIALTLIGHHR
jgi:hypothetical protein